MKFANHISLIHPFFLSGTFLPPTLESKKKLYRVMLSLSHLLYVAQHSCCWSTFAIQMGLRAREESCWPTLPTHPYWDCYPREYCFIFELPIYRGAIAVWVCYSDSLYAFGCNLIGCNSIMYQRTMNDLQTLHQNLSWKVPNNRDSCNPISQLPISNGKGYSATEFGVLLLFAPEQSQSSVMLEVRRYLLFAGAIFGVILQSCCWWKAHFCWWNGTMIMPKANQTFVWYG